MHTPEHLLVEFNKEQYIELATELSRESEPFPFPGIKDNVYMLIKQEEELYFPDPTVMGEVKGVDEIIDMMNAQGIRIDLGNDPASANVCVLPMLSANRYTESLKPRQLVMTPDMDERLKRLILMDEAQRRP